MMNAAPNNVPSTIPPGGESKHFSYEYELRVTFCMTNAEGNVNHHEYARLFGVARELFALDFVPGFAKEAGRTYLLKTRNAAYEYLKDFYFGDTIKVNLWVEELSHASFILVTEYINLARKRCMPGVAIRSFIRI